MIMIARWRLVVESGRYRWGVKDIRTSYINDGYRMVVARVVLSGGFPKC